MIEYWTKEGRFECKLWLELSYSELHRTDGPAIIRPGGTQEWWLWGEQLTQIEHFNQSPYFQDMTPEHQVLERLKICKKHII